MSDFIFSSTPMIHGAISSAIQTIYRNGSTKIKEYHGRWGSIGVSKNLYNGFQPLETEDHIVVVIGGPVLSFCENIFLNGEDQVAGTRAVYERWISGNIRWDDDLSGPFVFLIIEKFKRQVTLVTDLMMFIPVFKCQQESSFALGTHVDSLAKITNKDHEKDPVSIVDFILNDVVTYPHTIYKNLFQCSPASVATFRHDGSHKNHSYWTPSEDVIFKSLGEAADYLRQGLQRYIQQVTSGMTEVAQFISAGEDSRAIAGILSPQLKRKAFIFLDSMNREGLIARKVARSYGLAYFPRFRSQTYYLDILEEASDLIGSGCQYIHAHTLGFHKVCALSDFSAVFGGFLSDTLLKGHHIKKINISKKLPFFPDFENKSFSPVGRNSSNLFKNYGEVERRQVYRLNEVRRVRPSTFKEWFNIWPCSMHNDMPNLYSNRRLFRIYEPFMCKEAVKVSAAAPNSWKLNRRLFIRAVRPFLSQSRFLLHADGRFPYFPWWLNLPIQFSVWTWLQAKKRIGFTRGNQGPWADWSAVAKSDRWKCFIKFNERNCSNLNTIGFKIKPNQMFKSNSLKMNQKINLLQCLHSLHLD